MIIIDLFVVRTTKIGRKRKATNSNCFASVCWTKAAAYCVLPVLAIIPLQFLPFGFAVNDMKWSTYSYRN